MTPAWWLIQVARWTSLPALRLTVTKKAGAPNQWYLQVREKCKHRNPESSRIDREKTSAKSVTFGSEAFDRKE